MATTTAQKVAWIVAGIGLLSMIIGRTPNLGIPLALADYGFFAASLALLYLAVSRKMGAKVGILSGLAILVYLSRISFPLGSPAEIAIMGYLVRVWIPALLIIWSAREIFRSQGFQKEAARDRYTFLISGVSLVVFAIVAAVVPTVALSVGQEVYWNFVMAEDLAYQIILFIVQLALLYSVVASRTAVAGQSGLFVSLAMLAFVSAAWTFGSVLPTIYLSTLSAILFLASVYSLIKKRSS